MKLGLEAHGLVAITLGSAGQGDLSVLMTG